MARPSPGCTKSWTRTGRGCPPARHSRPAFLNCPTSSFFLVSTEIAGWPWRSAAWTRAAMCSNWAVAIGVPRTLDRLAIGLQAVAPLPEQYGDHPMARAMALAGQFAGQVPHALAGPPQRRLRISPRGRLDQLLQVRHQRRILIDRALAPPART